MLSLNRNQKEAVGLLSIGTFLEYFDLMLYVHMAALLNELFFPETDPYTAQLLLAFTFCSTYLLRPIGALIFGWIGDNIGRKSTVIITTAMMAISCIVMGILPTYAQIGITATCLVIVCRIVQGMSSMAEVIGAEIYLTETISPPKHYSYVALLAFLAALGGTAALGVASLVTMRGFNWRYAFLAGAVVALVGSIARTALRETPDFADAKRRVKKVFQDVNKGTEILKNNPIWIEKINLKTALALFLIRCPWPVFFFLTYLHCGNVLKESFGYSTEQVIHQNFILSIVEMLGVLPLVYLGSKIYPLVILKFRLVLFTAFILITPYLLDNAKTPFDILLIQSFIMFFVPDTVPAIPIFYKYFPVFKRFTSTAFLYALSRALMFVVTSFGSVYLIDHYGNNGMFIIIIPLVIGYAFGILHFEKLEKAAGNYPQKKTPAAPVIDITAT
jgi:MHS family proline/betaine transporter-like MFS transporter